MLINPRHTLVSAIFLLLFSAPSLAGDFSGEISFSNCRGGCNASGEPEIQFHDDIDFTLRLVIDEKTYFPLIKVVNQTNSAVEWSFHMVFLDQNDGIVAAFALSGETGTTNKYGQSNSSSRIRLDPSDMARIAKYKTKIYSL